MGQYSTVRLSFGHRSIGSATVPASAVSDFGMRWSFFISGTYSALGAPKAITAMARKLACLFYRLIKHDSRTLTKKPNTMKPGIARSRSDPWPNGRKSLAFNWLFPRLRESAMQGFWKILAFLGLTVPIARPLSCKFGIF